MRGPSLLLPLASILAIACADRFGDDVGLSKRAFTTEHALRLRERRPDTSEAAAIGPLGTKIDRRSREFRELVLFDDPNVVIKDEEGTGADRLMTPRLRERLHRLGASVAAEWPGLRLRVTEAWDERREHGENSVHYEGRAADITTSDVDPKKLGRLARLAIDCGLDWVFFEDASHVHVSVRR